MERKDAVVIDLDGNLIEGIHKPSSEWRMHAEIYRQLPEVGAIVHTHSPYAASFAVLHKEIPVILIEMIPFLKGSVEVSPYAPVSYTHLDVYKRQTLLCARRSTASGGE